MEGHLFGTRCPICMGETRVALSRQLINEPGPARLSGLNTKEKQRLRADRSPQNIAVLLDNIRSAWNVGSILRSADGFGFHHVYLCGITPTADNESVTKTSLGAEDSVPWSYHKDAVRLVKGLRVEGWNVYALEEDARSQSLSLFPTSPFSNPVVLIVGNEITGVDPDLLDMCDEIFYIPMRGEKKSFNVAIAFGVAAYALTIQNLKN
jgi:23S rRNA (guanosine2251-2'-O)-methyltransferase